MLVLLFYKFVEISDPQKLVEDTKTFCTNHNLKGRILITNDGINGTVAGELADAQAYKTWMQSLPEFADLWFKEQTLEHNPFPRMQVRMRKELVTLRVPVHPKDGAGKHINPEEINELAKDSNTVFFDARNEIESRIGKFKNAICPNIETFRDIPRAIAQHKEELKGKNIIMYCTGGIRCETASVLMKEAIPDAKVYQVNGGIYNYCQSPNNALWEGTCYVFDDRMQVGWDANGNVISANELPQEQIISRCEFCMKKTSRIINDERHLNRVERVCCKECDLKNDISRIRTKEERAKMIALAKQAKSKRIST